MKINKTDLNLALLSLTFYEITLIPHYAFLAFKYLVILYIVFQYRHVWKKNKAVVSLVGAYGLLNCFSTAINGVAINTVVASLFFGIQIVDIFLLCISYIQRKSLKSLVRVVLIVFLALLVVNDALFLVMPYDFSDPNEEYLIGNKFIVSYQHCFTLMLALVDLSLRKKTKASLSQHKIMIKKSRIVDLLLIAFFSIFSILICAKVTCSTGIITCAVMLLVILLPKKLQVFLADGKLMILAIGVVNILVLSTYSLLTLPFFENLIYNVLGKSYTWKGRLIIWASIGELFIKKPIFGYGYYSGAVNDLLGFGNPQNGVLKLLIDTGIVGLILYFIVVWRCFRKQGHHEAPELYPVSAFFYAMMVASLVEINLTHMIVFMALAMFYAQSSKIWRT